MVVCITGMHRSGTSALAGALEDSGLFFGPIRREGSTTQPKGNRENLFINFINDSLLLTNQASWDKPRLCNWPTLAMEHAKFIIDGMNTQAKGRDWAFKDPRTVWTLEGWKTLIPDLKIIGVYRHPEEVISSLVTRDRMPVEEAIKVWNLYNRRLLFHMEQYKFPTVRFDENFEEKIEKVCDYLGLKYQLGFYEEGHRHFIGSALPDETQEIWGILEAHEFTGSHEPAQAG